MNDDDDEKKRFFFFAENWLSCSSRLINFEYFGTSEVVFAKSEKNPIPSLKFRKISNLKSDFFLTFQKKSRMFQNMGNLFSENHLSKF